MTVFTECFICHREVVEEFVAVKSDKGDEWWAHPACYWPSFNRTEPPSVRRSRLGLEEQS